ncbi:hypothetical protein BC567DRAFT_885 [Phyllosticta citribraziliensis]
MESRTSRGLGSVDGMIGDRKGRGRVRQRRSRSLKRKETRWITGRLVKDWHDGQKPLTPYTSVVEHPSLLVLHSFFRQRGRKKDEFRIASKQHPIQPTVIVSSLMSSEIQYPLTNANPLPSKRIPRRLRFHPYKKIRPVPCTLSYPILPTRRIVLAQTKSHSFVTSSYTGRRSS